MFSADTTQFLSAIPHYVPDLFFENTIGIPRTVEGMFALVKLKTSVLFQVQEKLDAASLGVGVDASFEFPADKTFEIFEELLGKDEGGALLLFGVSRRNHVVRPAIALGDGHHAVILTQKPPFGAANLIEAAASQLHAIVVVTGHAICDNHIDFAIL
jgi:hypothetical protein